MKKLRKEKPPKFYSVYKKCIEIARNNKTLYYTDIAEIIGSIPIRTVPWLKEICKKTERKQGFMLGAVVVRKKSDNSEEIPGDGFYDLAYKMDKLNTSAEKMSEKEKRQFWKKEVKKVYDFFPK